MKNNLDEIRRLTEEERLKAAEGIARMPFDKNKKLFKVLLGDESFRIRKAALDALLKTPHTDKLIDLFIDIINDQDNAGLRTAGVEGLTMTGSKAVEKIIKAIDVKQWELSKLLVDVLGDIGDSRTIPTLIELTHSAQENLATAAIEALGKLGAEDVIPHLFRLLKKKEIYILFSAIEALANLGKKGFKLPVANITPLISMPLLKKAVFDLLGSAHDPSAVAYLIEGIGDSKRPNREAAAKALLQLYNSVDEHGKNSIREAVKQLNVRGSRLKILSGIDPSVLSAGIRILGWSGISDNIPVIFKYAEDSDTADACLSALIDMGKSVRTDIITLIADTKSAAEIRIGLQYLSRLPDCKCPPPDSLSYFLKFRDAQDILTPLAYALGKYIDRQSLNLLVKLMASANKTISSAAVENFVKICKHIPGSAVNIIHNIVHDGNSHLRVSAAGLIADFYNKRMDADIKTLLNDSEAVVRASVISSIGVLKLKAYFNDVQIALTDENKDVRIEAIKTSAVLVPDKFTDISKWLIKDDDPWVRVEIIKHLKNLPKTKNAVGLIKACINDESPPVMFSALQALIDISINDCIEEINKIISGGDEDIIMEVIYMLGKAKNRTARGILKRLASGENQKIRENALSLIKKHN